MRSVKNTVRTGRTVVCTIHQPSLEIFQVSLTHIPAELLFTYEPVLWPTSIFGVSMQQCANHSASDVCLEKMWSSAASCCITITCFPSSQSTTVPILCSSLLLPHQCSALTADCPRCLLLCLTVPQISTFALATQMSAVLSCPTSVCTRCLNTQPLPL